MIVYVYDATSLYIKEESIVVHHFALEEFGFGSYLFLVRSFPTQEDVLKSTFRQEIGSHGIHNI
jgi:hypothetical protein